MDKNHTDMSQTTLTVLFTTLLFSLQAEAKRRPVTQPITDTLAGITLGKNNPLKLGWERRPGTTDAYAIYQQPPQTFQRDEAHYTVTTAYQTDDDDKATRITLSITFSDAALCHEELDAMFARFARAHDRSTTPEGHLISWPTETGHSLRWQVQCDAPTGARFNLTLH